MVENTATASEKAEILVFSGDSTEEVLSRVTELRVCDPTPNKLHIFCRDICKKASAGRYRAFVVFRGWDDFLAQTTEDELKYLDLNECRNNVGRNVLLFPGNGIYQKKMLSNLNKVSPYIAVRINELASIAKRVCDIDLFDDSLDDDITRQLRIFVSELVIADFWEKCGCHADYIIGHSMGEYAAASLCGVMSEEDALRLLKERGSVMKQCCFYRMSAVQLSAEKVLCVSKESGANIEIAAYNAPEIVTISGKIEDITAVQAELKSRGIRYDPVNTDYGGHFSGLRMYTDDFKNKAEKLRFNVPNRCMISTVYPEYEKDIIGNAGYWVEHIYLPVRFSEALTKLPSDIIGRVIDVGITPALLSMAMKNITRHDISWIPTVRAGRNYRYQAYRAIGIAFNSGIDINWDVIFGQEAMVNE